MMKHLLFMIYCFTGTRKVTCIVMWSHMLLSPLLNFLLLEVLMVKLLHIVSLFFLAIMALLFSSFACKGDLKLLQQVSNMRLGQLMLYPYIVELDLTGCCKILEFEGVVQSGVIEIDCQS